MIKVTIERVTTEKYNEIKNFITKSTPTDKHDQSEYGNNRKVLCTEEFATREVPMERTVRTLLLSQEIPVEESFNLARVIIAVNGLNEE